MRREHLAANLVTWQAVHTIKRLLLAQLQHYSIHVIHVLRSIKFESNLNGFVRKKNPAPTEFFCVFLTCSLGFLSTGGRLEEPVGVGRIGVRLSNLGGQVR